MPYFNRQELLNKSLEAYEVLYGDDVEICICDDGSIPPVIAEEAHIEYLPQKDYALNPCVPINRAVALATNDVIVLTNPEILHTAPILYEMQRELVDESSYVTASCKAEDNRWLAHSSVEQFGHGRGHMPKGAQFHFCAMFHKALWDKTGGFDEDYREGQAFDDNDWLFRLQKAEATFIHRDDLIVYHTHTGTRWPAGGWIRNKCLLEEKWSLETWKI